MRVLELYAAASTTSFHSYDSGVAQIGLLLSAGLGIFRAEVNIGVSGMPGRINRLVNFPLDLCGREAVPIHSGPDLCSKRSSQHWRRRRHLVLVGPDLLGHS